MGGLLERVLIGEGGLIEKGAKWKNYVMLKSSVMLNEVAL